MENPKGADDRMTKDQKRLFIVFTKVLLRYLEQKDPVTYVLAKQTIREAVNHNNCLAAGEKCPMNHMKKRLESLVTKAHWKKAEEFLLQNLKDKQARTENSDSINVFAGLFNATDAFNHICSYS